MESKEPKTIKVQIDIDGELWAKFKAKVHHAEKTLAEVVPTVVEPALRDYVDPQKSDSIFEHVKEIRQVMKIHRCELCDMPTERLFASGKYRVCYACWKGALTAPETSNISPPSGPHHSSSVSGGTS